MCVSVAVKIHIYIYIMVMQNEFKLIKGVYFKKSKAEEADIYEIIHPNAVSYTHLTLPTMAVV